MAIRLSRNARVTAIGFTKPWTDPRDSSAAAIAAVALLELSADVTDSTTKAYYYDAAVNIQTSLSNPALYLADSRTSDGIVLHGTYSVPSNAGVNTSLIWGDYYFVQGCFREMNPPVQVTNLSATASAPNQVTLSWNAQSGAIRYSVKRSSSAGGPYTTIAPPPVLTTNGFTDTAVAAGTAYHYVVSASNVAGEGPDSAEASVTPPLGGPVMPDFTLSESLSNIVIAAPGASSAPVTLTVNGANGYNGTLSFTPSSCVIAPPGSLSTCSFNPASITGSGSTQLVISTTAPINSGALMSFGTHPFRSVARKLAPVGICIVFLMILAVFRSQRRFALVFGSLILIALSGLWACGGASGSGAAKSLGSGGGGDTGWAVNNASAVGPSSAAW